MTIGFDRGLARGFDPENRPFPTVERQISSVDLGVVGVEDQGLDQPGHCDDTDRRDGFVG